MSSEKLANPILVLTDHVGDDQRGYTLTEASRRIITTARALTDAGVWAIALNPQPDMAALGEAGVERVYVPDMAGCSPRIPAVVADCALACVKAAGQEVAAVLNVSNARGRDVAGQLAVMLASGASVEVSHVEVCQQALVASKAVLGGTWETEFQITRGLPVIGLRTASLSSQPAKVATQPQRIDVAVDFRDSSRQVRVTSSVERPQQGPVLTEASIVVCGGRGTNGDFGPVRKLAQRLGAAVGATRVATEEGWIDRSAQVGQSGESVAPALYIGLGISGDVHHVCGIRGAQKIVAVCDDPDAAIFKLADLGIVGDLNQVVDQALAELAE